MTDMLAMPAGQLGNPLAVVIVMEAGDPLLHGTTVPAHRRW
jgi:hypothetical protein